MRSTANSTPYPGRGKQPAAEKPKKRRKGKYPWWLKTKRGYARYINSPEWAAFRTRYYATHPRACFVCGTSKEIRLHHISYRRVGTERDTDVVPLCDPHHFQTHQLVRAGAPLRYAHIRLKKAVLSE